MTFEKLFFRANSNDLANHPCVKRIVIICNFVAVVRVTFLCYLKQTVMLSFFPEEMWNFKTKRLKRLLFTSSLELFVVFSRYCCCFSFLAEGFKCACSFRRWQNTQRRGVRAGDQFNSSFMWDLLFRSSNSQQRTGWVRLLFPMCVCY